MKAWALALLSLLASDAWACSCTNMSLSEKVDKASFVAVVRVETTRLRDGYAAMLEQEDLPREGWLPVLADFVPVEVFKGSTSDVHALATGFGGGDCGEPLIPGHDYLVLGHPVNGEITVGMCSGAEWLGLRSLVAALPEADRWNRRSREQILVDAVREQITHGTVIPECLDNNPRPPPDIDKCDAPEPIDSSSDED